MIALEEALDQRDRWLPPDAGTVPVDAVGERGWHALTDLMLPVVVLRETALRHNLDLMARFCARHGVSLAPHGKTTMSPPLIARQLAAGAWGVTAASPAQARLFRAWGVQTIILANQVVDPVGLGWLAGELAGHPDARVLCLVDSEAAVALVDAALAGRGRPLPVLLEMGLTGGRTGCRTVEDGLRVAAAIRASRSLALAGVECFEGVVHDLERVDGALREVRAMAEALGRAGAFDHLEEVLVTAGGSAYFDRVVHHLVGGWELGRPVRVVLRSGCYLTHDSGDYERLSPFGGRLPEWEPLRQALEVWGVVHSRPEPDLAIIGFGKRDVSYDVALPRPFRVRGRDGAEHDAAGMEVFRLNDQHAYVRLPAGADLRVGDLLGCGLAHPCTVFDKWRSMPVVDDDGRVVGAVKTYF
ncbi:MAG TPA: alanine racemase [Candidatus Dormibacteraeota bacterium]|nr:alanine racemase [Candidatus Dormibacteraeota bacterium]